MRRIILAVLALSVACASSGDRSSAVDLPPAEGTVDLTFFNQTTTDVTLFIQWRRDARLESERIRLGSLRGGATETFTVPYLGDLVTLSLDVPPSPPRTASGPGSAPTARLLEEERRGGSTGPVSTVMIDPGESIGWAIGGIAPPSVTSWRIE